MLVIFDFKCTDCNEVFETMAERSDPKANCPVCNGIASKILSAPNFHLDGTDPGFPGAYDKWARRHERAAKPK